MAVQDSLTLARDQAAARLAELDAVPADTRARMTYTDGVRTYDWNGYRAALLQQVKDLTDHLIQQAGGPFEVLSVARG